MTETWCVALTLVKPEFGAAVEQALRDLIVEGRKEAGVILYDMYRDLSKPLRFVFIERWESRGHFEAHVNSPHVLAYLERTNGMIEHAVYYALEQLA